MTSLDLEKDLSLSDGAEDADGCGDSKKRE
jgi:hypothetical protein